MKSQRAPSNHRKKEQASFDWETARLRIEESTAMLTGEVETAPETLERIWHQRALQLARAPEQDTDGQRTDLVLIRLGREDYALAADYVYDIRPARQVTSVPRVPEWVAGVANLRGRIMSVLDVRLFFNLPQAEAASEGQAQEAYMLVVRSGEMELALKVDQVLGVTSVPVSQIKDATQTTQGIPAEYVLGLIETQANSRPEGRAVERSQKRSNGHARGMAAHGAGEKQDVTSAVVLNVPNLLSDPRLIISEELV